MTWWDRVLGGPCAALPADALPGRYVVAPGAAAVIHGVWGGAGDHLTAGASGHWSASAAGTEPASGRFHDVELPGSLEWSAVAAVAERLGAGGALDWSRLTTESPLVHPTPEQLQPTRMDLEIKAHGPHLLEVCRRPHVVLDTFVEPTLASRAKRVPPRAVQHLAGHSEDWHRRTVTSVIPRRVLAQRVDERLDVYENRVPRA